ncbi:MAG: D-alanyl-D-alanine carboxypeptidase family protein [Dehalococcoidia bacterium]
MRRLVLAVLAMLVSLSISVPTPAAAATAPEVGATEVAVLDATTGALLYGKNEREAVHPASLTKMVTALVALEEGRLEDLVEVDVDSATMMRSTVMGLKPGMVLPLEDLLYGLMLPSGNDAALAIGRHIAGSDSAFVTMMNQRVRWMGLTGTRFVNPHGLDNPDHLTTAEDLARIARVAMQNDQFVKLASARAWTVRADPPYTVYNLNDLLGGYAGADGIKVGFTRRAGRALAASATRNGHRMIVVVLHSPNPTAESARLLDWAFAQRRAGLLNPS